MGQTPSPDRFVEVLGPAVQRAASLARALEGRVRNRPKEGEDRAAKAALTMADAAAQEAILAPLLEQFPEVTLQAEEDTPTVASFPAEGAASVVIDPIDGTLHSYLEGAGPYAVMTGLCIDARFEAALVALPREGLLFDAIRGGEARKTGRGAVRHAVRAEVSGSRVLVSHEMPEPVLERLRERGFEPAFGSGGAISVAPLIPGVRAGLRLARDPSGISIRGRIGLVIARAAQALVANELGEPFPEVLSTPARAVAVAATERDLELLRQAIAAAL